MLSLRFLTILSIPVLVTAVPLEMTHSSDSEKVSNGKTPDIKELSDLYKGIYWEDVVSQCSGEQFSIIPEATRMAAEVAYFGHIIIYNNEGFNRYFAGDFGGNGWLVCALLFLFRSSLALAKEERKHNRISHFKSTRKLERMVSLRSIHGSKLFRTSSTDILDVLTADNYAWMFFYNWYYAAFGWFHDESKQRDSSDPIDESINDATGYLKSLQIKEMNLLSSNHTSTIMTLQTCSATMARKSYERYL
jgi:hypothetical protein